MYRMIAVVFHENLQHKSLGFFRGFLRSESVFEKSSTVHNFEEFFIGLRSPHLVKQ
jgi:hypothetical protein